MAEACNEAAVQKARVDALAADDDGAWETTRGNITAAVLRAEASAYAKRPEAWDVCPDYSAAVAHGRRGDSINIG
ncbi:hypothetical protein LY76DRAFT_529152 [Colletotrichum caudatum]|nr:hypothetical protein LY76DRAFT_529152 [Colletotrichum caudatum]